MYTTQKALSFLGLCIATLFYLGSAAQAQNLMPQERSKEMKTMRWSSPDPKAESSSDKTKPEEKRTDSAETGHAPKTPEEKLWEKYKRLAEQGQKNMEGKPISTPEDDDKAASSDQSAKKTPPLPDDPVDPDDVKKDTKDQEKGLQGILENYKKAQKEKTRMNTKSFGGR